MKYVLSVLTLLSILMSSGYSQDTVQVKAGWNLIGSVKEGAVPDVLMTQPSDIITTSFFGYDPDAGYQPTDTLDKGLGYWIKVNADGIVIFPPSVIVQDTVEVKAGWNIIGSLENGNPADILNSEPPGIISTPFYGYAPGGGYQHSYTLKKGLGYWVKVSVDGVIIFNPIMSTDSCGVMEVAYEGGPYHTVKIGNQCWLKENLDVGVMIDSLQDATNNGTIEKYCYNHDPANCATYGGLYRWNEAMQYSTTPGSQGICPPGWHIPTLLEFQTLWSAVGGDGNALKEVGVGTGSGAGTNTSGFSALLAGGRGNYDDGFYYLGFSAYFWSSTEFGTFDAFNLSLGDVNSSIYLYSSGLKINGFSVRCLED